MKTSTTLLLIAALLGSHAQAYAQQGSGSNSTQSDIDEARRRFMRGVELYREGSYDSALAEFTKAYQLSPNYRVLYNIAQVQTERHDYIAALKLLEQYLRDGAAEISPERRELVEDEAKALKSRIAEVTVAANVDGAELLVDGVSAGDLPLKSPLLLNSGLRRLQVRKDGYAPATRTLTVAGGEAVRVDFEMKPEPRAAAPAAGVTATATGLTLPPSADAGTSGGGNAPMWISIVATGLFAGATVTSAVLTRSSDHKLDRELDKYPANPNDIHDARDELKRNALMTDIFGAATVLAGGFSIYFALSGGSSKSHEQTTAQPNLRLIPTGPGLRLRAQF